VSRTRHKRRQDEPRFGPFCLERSGTLPHKLGVARDLALADTEYCRRSVARIGGEVAYLVDAGLSPLAAIQAATIGGDALLGIAGKTGSVEPNLEADLIAVDGNLLERIWVLQNPLLVMSNGQIALNALDPSKRSNCRDSSYANRSLRSRFSRSEFSGGVVGH